ncbi:MAG: FIST N-terminal domain-containing protein [Armatimonadota bacterium]
MKIASSWSTAPDAECAVTEAFNTLVDRLESLPDYIMVFTSVAYDSQKLMATLKKLAPDAQTHGGTSCAGIITEEGPRCDGGRALGLWGICDKAGSYGVGAAPRGEDSFASAAAAVTEALRESGRPGEIPELVIMIAEPGYEEIQIQGIQDVVGPDVPIIGGSSADDDFSKPNQQFANGRVYDNALSVAVMFPSAPVGYAFYSGYTPTDISGIVTRCEGRILYEIDNRPAATVYHEWVDKAIQDFVSSGGNVLEATDLYPFGKIVGDVGDMPYYRLVYSINPEIIKEDNSMTMLAEVNKGDRLFMMFGTKESLIPRAGRAVQTAMDSKSLSASEVSGVFLTYCAGYMLAIKDEIPSVVDAINNNTGGKPLLGAFTYGEQGCFRGGENCHGNLMVSTLVFGR